MLYNVSLIELEQSGLFLSIMYRAFMLQTFFTKLNYPTINVNIVLLLSIGMFYSVTVKAATDIEDILQKGIRGVNLFYLDGRDQEDLPQITQKLINGDAACKGTKENILLRLRNTLKAAKEGGFNWIRLLIGKGFYQIYASRCRYNMDDIYPSLPKDQATAINLLLQEIRSFDFNIELVLGGSHGFTDIDSDIIFFDSILTQINLDNIGMIMLGGDIQPARIERHANWITKIYQHFSNLDSSIGQLNYSFDTVTYSNIKDFKNYLLWTIENFPDIPVIAINLYNRSLPPGADWRAYSHVITPYLNTFRTIAGNKVAWVDEYGFRLSTPNEKIQYDKIDQLSYYKGFFHATRCISDLKIATFAWTIGNDKYMSNPAKDFQRTPFGLFSGYSNNNPTPLPAWEWLIQTNSNKSFCGN